MSHARGLGAMCRAVRGPANIIAMPDNRCTGGTASRLSGGQCAAVVLIWWKVMNCVAFRIGHRTHRDFWLSFRQKSTDWDWTETSQVLWLKCFKFGRLVEVTITRTPTLTSTSTQTVQSSGIVQNRKANGTNDQLYRLNLAKHGQSMVWGSGFPCCFDIFMISSAASWSFLIT